MNQGIAVVSLLFVAAMSLPADVLFLANGKKVTGTFLGGDARTIRMEVNNKIESFRISEVASVQFGDATSASPAAAPTGSSTASNSTASNSTASNSTVSGWGSEPARPSSAGSQPSTRPAAPSNASPSSASSQPTLATRSDSPSAQPAGTIPAGTLLRVQMIDSIDSSIHRPGETFRASLQDAVTAGDQVVIARGSDVTLRLMEAQGSGRVQGKALLKVEAVSVRVDGKSYPIFTEAAVTEGDSRTAESAKVIGGTAAVGAIIGAIAGGGKGAAIGAAAGAGAGTGIQVLRGSESIKVPSESLITFRTTQSVRIY